MTDYWTKEELEELYLGLPETVQDAMFSPTSSKIYDTIQERYQLDKTQRETLSVQAGFLMMGLIEPKQFVVVLANALGVDRNKAAYIAQEVNREILHTIKNELREIHGLNDTLTPKTTPSGLGQPNMSQTTSVGTSTFPSAPLPTDQKQTSEASMLTQNTVFSPPTAKTPLSPKPLPNTVGVTNSPTRNLFEEKLGHMLTNVPAASPPPPAPPPTKTMDPYRELPER